MKKQAPLIYRLLLLVPLVYTVIYLTANNLFQNHEIEKEWAQPEVESNSGENIPGKKTTTTAALIKIPDAPPSYNYTPNAIKDIQVANPSTGISPIEVPVASNSGTAVMTYPFKIPAGRAGMQPELSIQYNSETTNGWLGAGWNLSTPAISIEARWGVPRYSDSHETETYLLNGSQLSPVAHRSIAISRTIEKQFFPRVEKDFQKIIRHGNHPVNYWWEVTDKNGKRHFYGGTPETGIDPAAILTDASGNVAHWALRESRDRSGNFVKYHYKKVIDAGVVGGTVQGYQLYIQKITYTGYGSNEGRFSVLFESDRDLNETKRKDIIINARLGFKQVTADRLRKIKIQYNGNNVRSYELTYHEGPFFRTLLNNLIEFDLTGAEFYRHGFEYYNEINPQGTYQPFSTQQVWQSPFDDIHGSFINPIQHFGDQSSALGGNKSSGLGGGLAVTFGFFDAQLWSKSNTAGGIFSYSKSNNEGLLQLVDINGDGLPDKVYKKNNRLFYRPNQSGPNGQLRFGEQRSITGAADFDKGSASTIEGGAESNFFIYAGFQTGKTTNERAVYFTDVNGDQLMDLVNNGVVLFNRLNDSGDPLFNASSSGTPSPIQASGSIDPSLITIDSAELAESENSNPLHDIVKIWVAPYDGTVSITNPVQLVEDIGVERQSYFSADGVRVAIQHGGVELWHAFIQEDDYAPKFPAGTDLIIVNRGDHIYFRVQSIYNGAYDQVQWEPVITYTNHIPELTDANHFPLYQFNAAPDFLNTAPASLGINFNGEVQVESVLVKPVTTDDIQIEILKKDSSGGVVLLLQQQFPWDSVVTQPINFAQVVHTGDEFYFRVTSSSNINWGSLNWKPRVYYTRSDDPEIPAVNNSNGDPIFEFFPVVDLSIYNKTINPSIPWVASLNGTVMVTPQPAVNLLNALSGTITFSIKKKNVLIAKEDITVQGPLISGANSINVDVVAGDSLYLEYHARKENLWNALTSANAGIIENSIATSVTPGAHIYSVEKFQFGTLHRHWGQFGYNGNRERSLNPINESELFVPNNSSNNLAEDKFIYMIPDARVGSWKGYDEFTYVTPTIFSASRFGEDDLLPTSPVGVGGGSGAVGIKKISITKNFSVSAGFVINGSYSNGNTVQETDFVDMNGDSYPDIISKNKIQYTRPEGGLESAAKNFAFGEVDNSDHSSIGFSRGGTFLTSAQFNSKSRSRGKKSSNSSEDATASASISGNFNTNSDHTTISWVDINGDGLPDRVHRNGDVELNLGYSFAPRENWGYNGISEGNTIGYGGGLGINLFNNSIAAGIGLTRNENSLNIGLRDMNGDGLPDQVIDRALEIFPNSDPITVALNRGNGFAAPIAWTGAHGINEDISTGESANGAFTICFPITPLTPVAKICTNPSVEASQGATREKLSIIDMNGDEYPDFLESDSDDDLRIKRSTIGKTNLLRSVQRPMGANFEINYTRIGNTYANPNSIWALESVISFDGVTGDGADWTYTTFEYDSGFYNRHEREFYGFKTVKKHEHDTENGNRIYRTQVKEFNNSNYYENGLLISELLLDSAGKKFNETVYRYELKNIHTGNQHPPGFENSDSGEAFPALVESRSLFYEGQDIPGKSSRVTYNYDGLGNVVSYTDFGNDDPLDDCATQIEYHSLPGIYIMNIPKSIVMTGGGQTLRKQEQIVNAQTGDVIEIRNYSDQTSFSAYNLEYDIFGNISVINRPPNENSQRLTYSYEYDPDVQSYVTRISDSYNYVSTFEYDVRFGQVLLITDINNHRTRYTIDHLGRITTVTGPMEMEAGLPFTMSFDYHPFSTVPWAHTRQYDPEHPNNYIETVMFMDGLMRPIQLKKDGMIHQSPTVPGAEVMIVSGIQIHDAFSRTIETFYPITEPKGNEGIYNAARDNITPTKSEFDILDRELKRILPDGNFSTNQFGFGFDRDRKKQFTKLMTDANGIKTEDYIDVRGNTTSTKNFANQQRDIWTSFTHNAVNELIGITDNEENRTFAEYDWQGRRTKLIHPDAGTTSFQYNPAGQVTSEVTGNLQGTPKAIVYRYDHERLSEMVYPDNPENNVRYTYGERNAPYNRAGRIVVQEDATGAQEFFYNPIGNISLNMRSIIIPQFGVHTYKTLWNYDTWNRLQSMVYPDGERLEYSYNEGGLLSAIQGEKDGNQYPYLTQMGYDKFERKTYLRLGNGTETFYTYESQRQRLQQMIAETGNNRQMMNTTYSYDNERNIVGLVNTAVVPTLNFMGGPSEYHYTYDELYRLTKATGYFKGNNNEQRFEHTMLYSSAGDNLLKEQTHEKKMVHEPDWVPQKQTTYSLKYGYSNDKPHAPTQINTREYSYDANGNQSGWVQPNGQQRTIIWDEENRISAIADNGVLFGYTYDAAGERVLKIGSGKSQVRINGQAAGGFTWLAEYTVYVNAFFIVKGDAIIKHYYAEDMRIASRLDQSKKISNIHSRAGESSKSNIDYTRKEKNTWNLFLAWHKELDIELPSTEQIANRNPVGNFDGMQKVFVYFYHPDHVGNSSFITDSTGEVFQHMEYFPFGEIFVEEYGKSHKNPYLFNGKELDTETGLYYYGARYYDSKYQLWQSADPMMEDYPSWSPYNFSFQSPINYSDPDGREPDKVIKAIADRGFVKLATYFFEHVDPVANPYTFDEQHNRVFWSGRSMKAARKYADANNAITLEMTFEGQQLDLMTKKLTDVAKSLDEKTTFGGFDHTEQLWKQLSKGFAMGATGIVTAILRPELMRVNNIYEADEKPKLIKNQKQFRKMIFKEIKIAKNEDPDD